MRKYLTNLKGDDVMSRLKQPATEFGKWMKRNMEENDITFDEIADIIRDTRSNIVNHYHQRSYVPFTFVMAYCDIFNSQEDPDDVWKMLEGQKGRAR